ncbi:DUF5107 domain-containing protein [Filimonas effusa]|uniref:DUF5107 domain-containing protein n=1 Tax=Filimonas effusa TaxID=2508721 RepID=A0A4Q1DBF4_9BACT|nr:DUF5107 domain-containing protein [Filimonas effusa]RXK86640.1 DUF5107 domain-containing protein [Filimonas effusa]
MQNKVMVWEEEVIIPTYPVGTPEKNPMFLERRVYQGSSGVVYPHAVIEKIYDEKIDKKYHAVFLENKYIKVMILPELGGRIQMAYDKVKDRHFVYYNRVIKPALVGLTGPWISGGIEFNWPQHHRPSTFEPVDFTIEEHADGSKTVWVNEVERMFRTKGRAGFRLYPDKAYIEIEGRLYNRTPFAQTFLWWANPAVKVNDHYQSVFPPDVYAVFDHGKRDVSSFPIAKGEYYKVNYAPGTDISRYKNIPVPTSYMAIRSEYDFIGGYEHDVQGGLLHVADHHVATGKKQWTWGNGAFGQAWDRNLTDEDGPYIELMTGVFTDNQPDFSWLHPYEEKTFVQYFMPYREVGNVKNATKEAIVNIELNGANADIRLYTTAAYKRVKIVLFMAGVPVFEVVTATSPEQPYCKVVSLDGVAATGKIYLVVTDLDTKKELVSYREVKAEQKEIPDAAQAARQPEAIADNEELYLTGLHLEQYRHATFAPERYYEEALRRHPGDVRNNNALGLRNLKAGRFEKAEGYFRQAIATLTRRNPNPYDSEAYYNLGWSLVFQGKNEEAFDAFYKCVWNDAWQHAGFFNLARLACKKGDFEAALVFIEKSLLRNYNSHSARHARCFILRKLGRAEAALAFAEESLGIDPFNFGCLFEQYLLLPDNDAARAALHHLKHISRNWEHNYLEYALDYAHAGLYRDAGKFLEICHEMNNYTLLPYYMGWFALLAGDRKTALACFREGASRPPDFIFPNRLEELCILEAALKVNPTDAKALYFVGNFWYDKRQYDEAISCWEQSAAIDDQFPTVFRNLALAYYNKRQDAHKALTTLRYAFQLDTSDARVLMELDQLHRKMNVGALERLQLLESYPDLVIQRDDLYLERITLYNITGGFSKAKTLLEDFTFHPWEGGEGKVVNQHLICHLALAREAIAGGLPEDALRLLEAAENYPENLGEGKLYGCQENDIAFLKGLALEKIPDHKKAVSYYRQATEGISKPVQAVFYNDPQPDKIFYQGLAWLKLGEEEKAREIFERLIAFGEEHIEDHISIDYFAVSLPDLLVFDADLDERNRIHCLYMMGLGHLGMGGEGVEKASGLFEAVLRADNSHQGAITHLAVIKQYEMMALPVVTDK